MATGILAEEATIPKEFVLKTAKAEANTRSPHGAAYDRLLGEYFQSLSSTGVGLDNCLTKYPGPQNVFGYFEFKASGAYSLELEPRSKFATCLSNVFNGQNPPKPSRLPYLNGFKFEFDG